MSYDLVWGIPFSELRNNGFRPLKNQAWAGVKTPAGLEYANRRATYLGFNTKIALTRSELHTRNRYTLDLSNLGQHQFCFSWSLLPVHNPNVSINVGPDELSAYGFFKNEVDALIWKMSLSQ